MSQRDKFLYFLLRLVIKALGLLPQWASDLCSRLLGIFWFKMDKRHRQVTLDNLSRAYGKDWSPARQKIVAKQVFQNLVAILFEMAWSLRFDQETLLSYFTVTGLDYLESAHAKGKGIIGLTCHMGNFELFTPIMGIIHIQTHAIYRKMDSPVMERFFAESRRRFGVKLIPLRNASEKARKALQKGEFAGTMLDQSEYWQRGVVTDFFGIPTYTNKGIAKLAMETGAAVVPFYTIRKKRQVFVEFFPEIDVVNTGDSIKDIETNTQRFTTAIEVMIRKCPEQYFWVHNRWKRKTFCLLPSAEQGSSSLP